MVPVFLTAKGFHIFMKTKLGEIVLAKHCIAASPNGSFTSEFDSLIMLSHLQTQAIDRLRENLIVFSIKN